MKKTILAILSFLAVIFTIPVQAAIFGGGTGTINQLDQWKATTTPNAITQSVYGKPLLLTGLDTGKCLTLASNGVATTTTCGGVSATSTLQQVTTAGATTTLSISTGGITSDGISLFKNTGSNTYARFNGSSLELGVLSGLQQKLQIDPLDGSIRRLVLGEYGYVLDNDSLTFYDVGFNQSITLDGGSGSAYFAYGAAFFDSSGNAYAPNVITNGIFAPNDFNSGTPGIVAVGDNTTLEQVNWKIDASGEAYLSFLHLYDSGTFSNGLLQLNNNNYTFYNSSFALAGIYGADIVSDGELKALKYASFSLGSAGGQFNWYYNNETAYNGIGWTSNDVNNEFGGSVYHNANPEEGVTYTALDGATGFNFGINGIFLFANGSNMISQDGGGIQVGDGSLAIDLNGVLIYSNAQHQFATGQPTSAPSIAWQGNSSTGFNNSGSNDIIIVNNNSISGGWNASGNLGLGTVSQIAKLDVNGGQTNKVRTVSTATSTIAVTDRFISVTRTATGTCTLTLPSATSAWNSTSSTGIVFYISDTAANAGANNITINRAGSDTIVDATTGNTSKVISTNGGTIRIQAINSTTWKVF